jgi:TPR repeat protein
MRVRLLLLILVVSVLFGAGLTLIDCAHTTKDVFATYVSNTPETYDLSSNEVDQLTTSANSNDPEAAYRLFLYFLYAKNDQKNAKHWCKRAAELGDSRGQKAYTSFYNNEPPLNRSDLSGK